MLEPLLPFSLYSSSISQDRLADHFRHSWFHPLKHDPYTITNKHLFESGKCAVCSEAYIVQTGNQPLSGSMTVNTWPAGTGVDIAGYDTAGDPSSVLGFILARLAVN